MKELSALYIKFQETLSNENFTDIDQFQDKDFLEQLSDKEKNALASLFLRRSSHHLGKDFREKEAIASIDRACSISKNSASLLIDSADLLYRLSLTSQKSHYLHQALVLLEEAYKLNKALFSQSVRGFWLWAKVIMKSFEQYRDETLIEEALHRFEEGEKCLSSNDVLAKSFYADYGRVELLFANRTQELTDYKRALASLKKASDLGESSPAFLVDWAEALYLLGLRLSDLSLLFSAEKILLGVASNPKDAEAYCRAWISLPLLVSDILYMTGDESYLKKADNLFKEALLVLPDAADLWLEWGWLFLRYGWLKKEVGYVEVALEKFTAIKVKESSPRRASALLGMAMVMMGLFLEDYDLLRKGREHILAFISYDASYPPLMTALGLSELALGLYFSEESYFDKAINLFERAFALSEENSFILFFLFEAHVASAILTRSPETLSQGIRYLKRLIELKPELSLLTMEWGIALFRFEEESRLGHVDEAIIKLKEAASTLKSEPALYHLALAFIYRGEEQEDCGDYEEALNLLEELIEKNPNVLTFHIEKAIALSRLGELSHEVDLVGHSAKLFDQLARMDKENDFLLAEFGYTLLLLYDWNEDEELRQAYLRQAERRLISAATLGSKEALYYLASLYSLANQLENALSYLKKAFKHEIFTDFEELDEDEWLQNLTKSELYKKYLAIEKMRE